MREVDLRATDLNLLPVLAALLTQRSVTGAAHVAGLSQPAMSRALGRLRAQLGDPLLVQGRLTPRAEALAEPLAGALAAARAVLHSAPFDPALERGVARIAAADVQTIGVLPRLVPRLMAEAPGLDLVVEGFSAGTITRLREGRLDLAVGVAGGRNDAGLRQRVLYSEDFLCLLRQSHPAAEAWNVESYARLDHVLVSTEGGGPGPVDEALAELGLSRRVALRIPHFQAAFGVVAASSMVVTLPAALARAEAPRHGLLVLEPPLPVRGFDVLMLWGELLDAQARHRWLRGVLAGLVDAP